MCSVASGMPAELSIGLKEKTLNLLKKSRILGKRPAVTERYIWLSFVVLNFHVLLQRLEVLVSLIPHQTPLYSVRLR